MSTDKGYRTVDDSFSIKDVGSKLLDHLAKGLYPEAEVLREYIQNAIDAHRIWKHQTNTEPEGPIQVEVRGDRLSVIDYGVGMSIEEVRKVKSIAITSKWDEEIPLTGHKGVGIWAGLSYFDILILETTKRGDPFGYRLTIHFNRIVESIDDRTNIGEVMDGNYFIEEYDEEIEKHSSSVTLVNPKRTSVLFASVDKIREAISRICPCEIDPNFTYSQKVKDWYEQQGLEMYSIVVDGEPVYRSYPSSVEYFKTFPITINDSVVAYGWQALHKVNGKLKPTHGELVGFRLIESGFTVGEDNPYGSTNLAGYQGLNNAVVTYLGWHIGEIHIITLALRPNLQRNNLEETETSRQFIQKLRALYAKLEQPTRTIADKRNAEAEFKSKIQDIHRIYLGYDVQISKILNRQILVDLTPSEISTLKTIQQSLLRDEQNADYSADTKEAKAYAHLKEKDVKELRKRLLKRLDSLLGSVSQKKERDTQKPQENTPSPVSPVAPSESKAQENPSGNGTVVTNDKNTKEKTDISPPPLPALTGIGNPKALSPKETKAENNGINNTFPSVTETPEIVAGGVEDAEEENSEQGTFPRPTSRRIPVVIVIGFLENILNEELPEDSDVKTAILSKLTERIDKVLSNVE